MTRAQAERLVEILDAYLEARVPDAVPIDASSVEHVRDDLIEELCDPEEA